MPEATSPIAVYANELAEQLKGVLEREFGAPVSAKGPTAVSAYLLLCLTYFKYRGLPRAEQEDYHAAVRFLSRMVRDSATAALEEKRDAEFKEAGLRG